MRLASSLKSRLVRSVVPSRTNAAVCTAVLVMASLLFPGCQSNNCSQETPPPLEPQAQAQPQSPVTARIEAPKESKPQTEPAPQAESRISLFDGETLGQWKSTDFGGQGEVAVKDGAIHMAMGSYMTGITWTGPVVRMNYEITLEAMRVQGSDFFCGLTFPVGEKPCTLVLGGWGGSVCGLSNIDYYDASENETTRVMSFETGKWYNVRLRVEPDRIQVWLDGEELVNLETTGHKIDIRAEVDLSQPLGIATWMTAGAVRNIRLKNLPEQSQ